jgi:hypothetical protein
MPDPPQDLTEWKSSSTVISFRGASDPGPTLRDLLRVLPVARSEVRGGLTVRLLSLELYTDGFVAQTRLWPSEAAQPGDPQRRGPTLALDASDDRGGRYAGRLLGGHGDHREWRYTHVFTPALDPAARELRLEVPEVRWWRGGPDGLHAAEAQPGPWAFTVELPEN